MPTASFLFELAAFLLGLLLGSFLNVCISRLPKHLSLSTPRSNCPHCHATIRWYDNIPVLSWILLRARCRTCKEPISWRYPATELAVGLWFCFIAQRLHALATASEVGIDRGGWSVFLPDSLTTLALAILGFLLIGLLVMDWQTQKLPDAFTLTGIGLAFVLICVQAVFLAPHADELLLHGRNPLTSPGNVTDRGNVILTGPEHLILGRLLAIFAAGAILFLIGYVYKHLRDREGLGLGDAKLMAMIAAFLGFWPAVLAMFAGFILCSAYALTLIVRGRATTTTRLPLGTFLAVGGLFAALIGAPVIAWYTSLL